METQAVNGAAKPVGRRNGIYGIVVDRLKEGPLREAAAQAGLAVGEGDGLEFLGTSLQELYKRQQAEGKVKLYQCEVGAGGCGADQPRDEGSCPFCGFDPDAPQKGTAPEVAASPAPSTDITDPEAVLGDTSPVEPRARKGKKDKAPKGRLSQPPPAAEVKEKPAEDMPVAGSSTGLAKVYPTELLVKDDAVAASELLTVRELDDAVDRFRVAGRNAKTAWWYQARAYLDIFEKKLWTLRVEDGKPKYKSLQEFASKELGITGQYQWDVLDAAKAWPEEDAAQLGMTNCVLILKAPEEARKKIADRVRQGDITATHHKVRGGKDSTQSAVSKAIKEKGVVETKASKTGERKPGGGRKKEVVKVTIADYLRKNTLGFLATPVGGEKAAKVTDVPPAVAKWLEKVQPYAQHESLDGEVVETFAVVVKDGALKLVIHRDRSTAGE